MVRPVRFLALAGLLSLVAASPALAAPQGKKIVQLPMRTDGPKSLDPVRGSTTYDNRACVQVYETLLQYKYLVRPPELEPLLLESMPEVSADQLTYRFKLKAGVKFHDNACFPGGKGREITSKDVFYSWKRMADQDNRPKSWWLYEKTIAGFDDYREKQNAADKFDYDAPVSGFKILNDREFTVTLTEPVQRFMWVLAMFQTSVVAREAVEHYGDAFAQNPVGTGPYVLDQWTPGKSMSFNRNPDYHVTTYPTEHAEGDAEAGYTAAAGTKLPICDRIEFSFFIQDQPMWLQFLAGNIGYTQVPAENLETAFRKRSRRAKGDRVRLKREFREKGIVAHSVPLLDYIFRGFNMDDQTLGAPGGDKARALRQAICHAIDWHEFNQTFYNDLNIVYDGPIPPGLDGHPQDHVGPISYLEADLAKANALMAEAGYPGGKGLGVIDYYVSRGGNSKEQAELTKRQLSEIGVKLNVHLVDFSQLIEAVNNKKAPLFSFAWGSDYPDAENNLALFYGPYESPGSNHFNYKNPVYDELYRRVRVMPPSDERTRLYVKMRDMVLTDCPSAGSMARTRRYLVQPWLKNFKPTENFYNWVKYLDVDEAKRP